jgi:hypothetical protein
MGSAVMTAVPHWDIVGPADTDADLARAAAAGDREAFAGIYDRYADRLHDFCVGMLRDRDDAARHDRHRSTVARRGRVVDRRRRGGRAASCTRDRW